MAYRRISLSRNAPGLPNPATAPALDLLEPDGPHNAMVALDTLGSSVRVLASCGLQGSGTFTIPDGEVTSENPGTRRYPDDSTPRVVLRTHLVPITAGHVLELRVLATPSGPTQELVGSNDLEASGAGGQITMAVSYTNGTDTRVVSCAVTLPISEAVYYGEPASPHENMTRHSAVAFPWAALASAADIEKWTRGGTVTASAVVSYVASPRVVSLQVVERPVQIVVEHASTEWPSNMYASAGAPYASLPCDGYPITSLSTTDPGGGIEGIRRALEQHGAQLGPCLAWWTSTAEKSGTLLASLTYDHGTATEDESPGIGASSTSFRHLPFTTLTHLSTLPGFQLGGYARQARDGDTWLDARTGVLPVWLVAYGKGGAVGVGSLQFRPGDDEWSAVNVALPAGYGWTIAPGWVEVGAAPESGIIGRFYGKVTGVGTWEARNAGVFMRQT
jgi:hypothetical protein